MAFARLCLPLLTLAAVSACGAQTPVTGWQLQDAAKVAGRGQEISRPDYAAANWYRATVPGTVLTSLVDDGVYPEPLYGENNRAIPESLCHTSYWYRATFKVPPHHERPRVWLNFAGINYAAEVWVDGTHVGDIKGAFARGQFDITYALKPGPIAAVAVRIDPPPHPGTPHEHTVAAGTGRNGGDLGADGPSIEATVGWDWIPAIRDRDIGIWQGVDVSTSGFVTVSDPFVKTALPLPNTDSATLTVQANVWNLTDDPQDGVLEGWIDRTGLRFKVPVSLAPGSNKVVAVPALGLRHPKLWWPNGYGEPNLYSLHLRFRQGRLISDEAKTSFGIRTIAYKRAGSDNLTLIVNGVPIFGKGGNWGIDEAMKRSPRERLEAQLRLHRDANCTMIRNWIGMSTEEDFYDLCDRYGILIWDDFWLANPVDGPNPLDPDLFIANAREKILRYRNHPSIAVWCGRNEGMPPAKINQALQSMTADLDGTRFYQPHSSNLNGVGGGGPYAYRKPADYFGPFRDAFHTEIGGPSIPTLEAIEAMMPRKDWWPLNDDWAEHDLCRGAQRGDAYPLTIGHRFGDVFGFEDFVRKAQLANYESYRAIFEGRQEQLFNPATGVLLWMSNPAQPSFVWQLYSYDLEPTAALFGTKKACEPVHVQMDPRDRRVFVVNSTATPLESVRVKATVYDIDSRVVLVQDAKLDVPPTTAASALTVDLHGLDPNKTPACFVRLEARDRRGRLLSDNFYWDGRPGPANGYVPGDLSAMQFMSSVALDAHASAEARGKETRVRVEITNPSKTIALMTHLQLRRANSNTRVLPAFGSDNYFSLVPGEHRTVTIECATADLKGDSPKVFVDGWNVAVKAAGEPEDVQIVTNDAAIPPQRPAIQLVANPNAPFVRRLSASLDVPGFVTDEDYVDGGFARPQNIKVDISGAGPNAAPAAVYQTPRTGEITYTVPVPPGRTYTVHLHFADVSSAEAGARRFNVLLNGQPLLTNFDIFKEAGGRARAVVREVRDVRPGSDGNIAIALRRGAAGMPVISAVEVLSN